VTTKEIQEIYPGISERCLTCEHLKYDWASRPFCALGWNVTGYCFDLSPLSREVVQ